MLTYEMKTVCVNEELNLVGEYVVTCHGKKMSLEDYLVQKELEALI